ncbi:MAG TPA: tetratricopeptide repeat protein, partial [Rhodanobacteraceae bacterium]|nr:tetratricopeptide repeat protein [Rhodanobacteraceae bacterium]
GLHAFCDAHAQDVRARLALFVKLCRAVQHAHQHLIVHRDIKPANILVRDDGTPVLLDFGIGKLIDDTARDATATHVFTPTYAAPEQIAGRAVTTATDIYGLGCVLHELLSGRALHEVAYDGRVPPPSVATEDPARARQLRGELDTLVGKAMREEPERRYASVQALSDDVGNWLAGRPLDAAPDSVAYRTRKFVARHRYAVLAAAIAAVVLGAFVWRLDAQTHRALAAEAHAEREAQGTRRSRDFLVSLFEAAAPDNALGHALSARELIDKGSAHVGQELRDEPETAARLDLTIAGVYAALGDPKAAIASGERALALVKADTPEHALLRAEILLTLGAPYDDAERFDDAKRVNAQALALRTRYAPDDHARIAFALTQSATAAVRRHDNDAARAFFDRALAEYAKAPHVEPADRAEVLRGLADLDNEEGRAADSIKHAEAALDALASLPPGSPDRIETLRMLANAKVGAGDAAAAIRTLEETLAIARNALGESNIKVADIENDLAVALNGEDRYREAIPHLEKAIAITEAVRPGDVAAAAFETINLGSIHESLGDYEKAEVLMRKGISAMESATPDDPHIDFFRGNLARTLMLRGDLDGAREMLDRAMRATAAREGEKSFDYAFAEFRLARVDLVAGQLDAAAATLDAAIATLDPLLPPEHGLRAQFDVLRGMIAEARGDFDAAAKAFATAEAHVGKVPLEIALVRMRLAGALLAKNDLPGAHRKLDAAMPPIEAALLPSAIERIEAERVASELDRRDALARH